MFGNAVVMGMTPADVRAMSLAEWIAACDGWERAHGDGDKPEAPSAEEYYRLISQRR